MQPLPNEGAFSLPIERQAETCYCPVMTDLVRRHYEIYPYPSYPLLASVRRCDTYALNIDALWARFNGRLPNHAERRILIAGSGSFSPYPFSVANPDCGITALDLSCASLKRARQHCLLHARRNVTFSQGDLLDPASASGRFGLIDAYGVLHHLDDPAAGLLALADRLTDHGVLRIMVYSRYARFQEESIRRAFRLLKVTDAATARRLLSRARPGSRLREYANASTEAAFMSGLADALLHPCVHTFKIDQLMALVQRSGLEPLLFAHHGARQDVGQEVARIRELETARQSPGNFVLYLGRNVSGPCNGESNAMLALNPCLRGCVTPLRLSAVRLPPRLGRDNPALGFRERSVLRRFTRPLPMEKAGDIPADLLAVCIDSLFLLKYFP